MSYWEDMFKKYNNSYDDDEMDIPVGITYAEKASLFGHKTKGIRIVFKDDNETNKKERRK